MTRILRSVTHPAACPYRAYSSYRKRKTIPATDKLDESDKNRVNNDCRQSIIPWRNPQVATAGRGCAFPFEPRPLKIDQQTNRKPASRQAIRALSAVLITEPLNALQLDDDRLLNQYIGIVIRDTQPLAADRDRDLGQSAESARAKLWQRKPARPIHPTYPWPSISSCGRRQTVSTKPIFLMPSVSGCSSPRRPGFDGKNPSKGRSPAGPRPLPIHLRQDSFARPPPKTDAK